MPLNTSIFSGLRGILRIMTLVIGVIDLGITADKYYRNYSKEEFFLAIVIIAFIISVIWTIVLLVGVLSSAEQIKNIDTLFHFITGILLVITAIIFLVNVFDVGDVCETIKSPFGVRLSSCSGSHYILRICAGILGIVNGVVYAVLGYFVYGGKG